MVEQVLVDEVEKLKSVLAEKEAELDEAIRIEAEAKQKAVEVEQKKKVLLNDLSVLAAQMEPSMNEIKGLENQKAQIQTQIDQKEAQLKPQKEAMGRIETELKTLEGE